MTTSRGQQLASFLTGVWRPQPSPLEWEEAQLLHILPLITGSGLSPLAWWRIRESSLAQTATGQQLRQEFYRQALSASLQEQHIEQLILRLRSAGIEAVLIKGWVNARLYPEKGLRPLGDIDILVARAQKEQTYREISHLPREPSIDLKSDFPPLYEWDTQGLIDNSSQITIGRTPLKVLSPEDHLRLLCLHFMRHGAKRALWLCDIAVLVENLPPEFDWDFCLRGSQRCSGWIKCAILLAHQLLGASLEGTPLTFSTQTLPHWLELAVLKLWETPYYYAIDKYSERKTMLHILRNSRGFRQGLVDRWPNPVEVAVASGPVPSSALRVLPHQFLWYAGKADGFFRRKGKLPSKTESI